MYKEWQLRLLVLLVKSMIETNHSYVTTYESGDVIITDDASGFTYKLMNCDFGNVIVLHDNEYVKTVTSSDKFNNDSNAIAWNCMFQIRDAEEFHLDYNHREVEYEKVL